MIEDALPQNFAANARHDRIYGFNPKTSPYYHRRPCPPYWELPPLLTDQCRTDDEARITIWQWYSEQSLNL